MNIGEFKHRIMIERPDWANKKRDRYGRETVPYLLFCTVYAKVQDVSGREFYEAYAHQMQDVKTFTIRYLDGLKPDMRIRWNGEIYDIISVNHLAYRGDFAKLKSRCVNKEGA